MVTKRVEEDSDPRRFGPARKLQKIRTQEDPARKLQKIRTKKIRPTYEKIQSKLEEDSAKNFLVL